jgi:hypothetical protein
MPAQAGASRPGLHVVDRSVVAPATQILCVVVRCDQLAVAIPAGNVTRLALADEVEVRAAAGVTRARSGAIDAAAWPLSRLLDLDAPTDSWVFLGVGDGARAVPLALGAGPCLAVRPLPPPERLPAGLFRRSAAAVVGAFRVDDALRDKGVGIVGVWIDPVVLIGVGAIDAARGGSPP